MILSGTVLGPSGALNNAAVTAYAASLFDAPPAVGELPPDGEQGVTMFGPAQSGSQFGGNGQYVIDNVVGGVAYYIASYLPTYNTDPTYYWKYDGSLLATGGGDAFAGTSPQNPVWLEPVDWAFIANTLLGLTIPAFTYSNGASGVGATVTESDPTDGTLTIDGGSPSVGDRVWFGTDTDSDPDYTAEGIYVVTTLGDGATVPWVLTRSADANTPETLFTFWAAVINEGSVFSSGVVAVCECSLGPIADGGFVFPILSASGSVALGFGSIANGGIAFDGFTNAGLIAIGGTASGVNAVAIGEGAVASGPTSAAFGTNATASGISAICFGEDSTAGGDYSTALGIGSSAPAAGGIASGVQALAWAPWLWALSDGAYSVQGGSQYDFWLPYNQTTDATPTLLGVATSSITLGPPEQTELVPPDFIRSMLLEFRVVARRTDVPGTVKVMECNNLVIDGDGSSSYRIVGTPTWTTVQEDAAASGWSAVAQLNGGSTGIEVQVTGEAGNTIQWTCTIKLYEVAG